MAIDLEILGRSLKQAQHLQHRTLDTALDELGTTLVQWDALRAIGNQPGASAHDLAVATFQTDQSFGTLANRLEVQGLIRREPGEGRRIAHQLTPTGERLLTAANAIAARIRAAIYAPLSDTDRRTLQRLLNRLLAG